MEGEETGQRRGNQDSLCVPSLLIPQALIDESVYSSSDGVGGGTEVDVSAVVCVPVILESIHPYNVHNMHYVLRKRKNVKSIMYFQLTFLLLSSALTVCDVY